MKISVAKFLGIYALGFCFIVHLTSCSTEGRYRRERAVRSIEDIDEQELVTSFRENRSLRAICAAQLLKRNPEKYIPLVGEYMPKEQDEYTRFHILLSLADTNSTHVIPYLEFMLKDHSTINYDFGSGEVLSYKISSEAERLIEKIRKQDTE